MSMKVIVIGGGAAGLLAAGRAAECGARVILLEKGLKTARKLRIAGKGRGNITNTADLKDFIEAFAPNGKFLYGSFTRFFRNEFLELINKLGIETKVERGGRVFPVSDRASDVADAILTWVESQGVEIKYNTRAKSIVVDDGKTTGVEVFGGVIKADAVIIATGGMSYPKTGSTGDGYKMAIEVGQKIVEPTPALSAFLTSEKWVANLAGLSLKNVTAALFSTSADGKQKKLASEQGEMLFTHTGVSGPIILTLSRGVYKLLKTRDVSVSIDLKPALSYDQLDARLIRDFKQSRQFKNYLPQLLPKSLAELFPLLTEIDGEKTVNTITATERAKIISILKDLRMTVKSLAPLDEAIVTSGGVTISEINPKTMESKLVKGLYFAGEVIDIDAITGGYNLQAAFSTGYIAGESAGNV